MSPLPEQLTTQQPNNPRPPGCLPDDVVVSVRNVSKKFCKTLRRSMAYGIADLARGLVGIKPDSRTLRKGEFWALDDVSFELRRGEVLGLIGVNGSGKTTLLRLLAGIFPPDKGQITVKGRVGALIALGAGFHPHMTGRENIYLNGAILGMRRREIEDRFDAIVDFAEIGDFVEAPVASYSSGMKVRLGFAIAIQLDPDVLLVDEVLAVGDVGFRAKCYNAIYESTRRAGTVFVSHSMQHVSRICSNVVVLDGGHVAARSSNVAQAIQSYLAHFSTDNGRVMEPAGSHITDIQLSGEFRKGRHEVKHGDPLTVCFLAQVEDGHTAVEASITVLSQEMMPIAQCNSVINGVRIENTHVPLVLSVTIPEVLLNPGEYYISVALVDPIRNDILAWHHARKRLRVMGDFFGGVPVQFGGRWEARCLGSIS